MIIPHSGIVTNSVSNNLIAYIAVLNVYSTDVVIYHSDSFQAVQLIMLFHFQILVRFKKQLECAATFITSDVIKLTFLNEDMEMQYLRE